MSHHLDKQLEEKRKLRRGNFEHHSECCDNFWKLIWKHPLTYLAIFIVIFFGIYQDWNLKAMISIAFEYFIVIILTLSVEHFILKRK